MVGLGWLMICTLVALFAYPFMPDNTHNGNFQVIELPKQPPGTPHTLILIPNTVQQPEPGFFGRLFQGVPDNFKPIPVQSRESIQVNADSVSYLDRLGNRQSVLMPKLVVREGHYWLGSDAAGRDVLSRLLLGTRVSMGIGLLAVLVSLLVGVVLGALAGFFRGRIDKVIMWFVSVVWSIPSLLLAISLAFVMGKGTWQLFLAIGISSWVDVARLVRGQIFSIREMQFVEATKALGYRWPRVIGRHILPNVLSPLIIIASANFASAILLEAGLSFLGVGIQPPTPSWGSMIKEGYTQIMFDSGVWLAIFPGLAIILVVISLNLVGFGLRDALDPKQKG
jgi:oligopeptide transport system permease protein